MLRHEGCCALLVWRFASWAIERFWSGELGGRDTNVNFVFAGHDSMDTLDSVLGRNLLSDNCMIEVVQYKGSSRADTDGARIPGCSLVYVQTTIKSNPYNHVRFQNHDVNNNFMSI